ncbi:MAG TPA: hypothetical protein VK742_21295 [Candidatus Sulfotelmatobacter sp.]|nr:hypothetical protein [Candidatus Sulfotelmatobacter sp.]
MDGLPETKTSLAIAAFNKIKRLQFPLGKAMAVLSGRSFSEHLQYDEKEERTAQAAATEKVQQRPTGRGKHGSQSYG